MVESIASVLRSSGVRCAAVEERALSTPGRMPDSEERYTWLTCGEDGSMVMITEASSAALSFVVTVSYIIVHMSSGFLEIEGGSE